MTQKVQYKRGYYIREDVKINKYINKQAVHSS